VVCRLYTGGGVPPALSGGVRTIGMVTDPLGTQYVTSTFGLHPLTDTEPPDSRKPSADRSNPFAGQDPIAVVREAIAFWHDCLDEIDRRVSVALVKEQPGSEQGHPKEDGT
jgi:hypothetical protein